MRYVTITKLQCPMTMAQKITLAVFWETHRNGQRTNIEYYVAL